MYLEAILQVTYQMLMWSQGSMAYNSTLPIRQAHVCTCIYHMYTYIHIPVHGWSP